MIKALLKAFNSKLEICVSGAADLMLAIGDLEQYGEQFAEKPTVAIENLITSYSKTGKTNLLRVLTHVVKNHSGI